MGKFPAGGCNRAVSSHDYQVGLTRAGVPDSVIMRQGRWYGSTMVTIYAWGEAARWLERGV